MVHLVIGDIDSGKTSFLKEHFLTHRSGGGILANKVMDGKDIIGYRASHLGSDHEETLMIHERHYHHEFVTAERIGPYYMNPRVLEANIQHIKGLIKSSTSPIYLDEIGRYELRRQGYHDTVVAIIASGLEAYMTCRNDLVEEIVSHFKIIDYELVDLGRKKHV